MRLILVRHAEPDYAHNTITEKGKREAIALAQRIKNWDVTDFYMSPLGRAMDTAKPTLEIMGRNAEIIPWAQEFTYPCIDPMTHTTHLCWDYVPSMWTHENLNFTLNDWVHAYPQSTNPDIEANYKKVCAELDNLLLKYGYRRDGLIYRTRGKCAENKIHTVGPVETHDGQLLEKSDPGDTVVIFCHLGISCVFLSHLLNIPFMILPHALFLPPASVTILTTEERWEDEASFRAQAIGDVSHLLAAHEPISSAGAFARAFQD